MRVLPEIASFGLMLLPAVYVWYLGRSLVRRLDDPAFPELRLAKGQRGALVFITCVVVGLFLHSDYVLLKVFLAILAAVAADFPARRAIFEESWSLPAYLFHTLRLFTGLVGPWTLVALAPALVGRAGNAAGAAALLLAGLALLWSQFNSVILPSLVGAVPLSDPTLQPELERVLAKSRCRRPRLLRAGPSGGHWVNAFALPSYRQPAVLFANGLLEALDPAETAAVLAHEIGHLEHFTRFRLFKRELMYWLLLAATPLVVLLLGADSGLFSTMTWLMPFIVLVVMAAMASRNQTHEHESDLRALELTGQPEPLISGLTKIHELMRMPRRWQQQSEGRLSHPSLARRIRAIREAAGEVGLEVTELAVVEEIVVRSADDPSEVVVMGADRLHWLHGIDADAEPDPVTLLEEPGDCRSIAYADLTDLRLNVKGLKARYLTAIDGRGQTLKLALRSEDVAAVKANLKRIEQVVRGISVEGSKALRHRATHERYGRLVALIAALWSLLPPVSFTLLLAALVAFLRPARATLAAAGAVALSGGLLGLRVGQTFYYGEGSPILPLVIQAVMGSVLLIQAIARGRVEIPEPEDAWKMAVAVLGVLGVLHVTNGLTRLASPLPIMQLHLWARHELGASLVLFGIVAALLTMRSRKARMASAAGATLILLLLLGGSRWLHDRFSEDQLTTVYRELPTEERRLEMVRERRIDMTVSNLVLSPSGRRLAARTYPVYSEDGHLLEAAEFRVELADGTFATLEEALGLAFLDDDVVAILSDGDDALVLQTVRLGPPQTVLRELRLPQVIGPTLRIDEELGLWEVYGTDYDRSRAILLSGEIGGSEVERKERPFIEPDEGYVEQLLINGGKHALAVNSYFDMSFGAIQRLMNPLSEFTSLSELSIVGQASSSPLAMTALDLWCVEPRAAQTRFICAASDRDSMTRLWSIDADAGRVEPIGTLPGVYYQAQLLPGDRILLTGYNVAPAFVDVSKGQAMLLAPALAAEGSASQSENESDNPIDALMKILFGSPGSGTYYHAAAMQSDLLALAESDADSVKLSVYRLVGE